MAADDQPWYAPNRRIGIPRHRVPDFKLWELHDGRSHTVSCELRDDERGSAGIDVQLLEDDEILIGNTAGNYNVATGESALENNTTGSFNTAMGYAAGYNLGESGNSGSDNIFLGANVFGTAADNNTMRLGMPYDGTHGQTQTFIAGIYGTALPPGSFVPVCINAAGQLGTALASPAVNGGQPTGIGLDMLSQQLQDVQTTIADLRARLETTEAANAALQVRLAELEARVGK
jgi:hypothetical protein